MKLQKQSKFQNTKEGFSFLPPKRKYSRLAEENFTYDVTDIIGQKKVQNRGTNPLEPRYKLSENK